MYQIRTSLLALAVSLAGLPAISQGQPVPSARTVKPKTDLSRGPVNMAQLSVSEVESRTGKKWTGIVYVCDPYCTFKALVQDGVYSPSLSSEPFQKAHLKLIASTNPLYPLLIQEFPVLPHLTRLSELKAGLSEKASGEAREQKIPPYAESKFDFGYSFEPGLGVFKGVSSNSDQVQSDWDYKGLPRIYGADLHLMRGRALRVFGQYLQFVVSGSYWTTSQFKVDTVKAQASFNFNQLRVMVVGLYPKIKVGVSLYSQTRNYQTANESLTLYSLQAVQSGLGLHTIFKNGLRFDFYYPMQLKLKENQGFRVSPFNQTTYNVNSKFCLDEMGGFDVKLRSCLFLDYYYNREEARLSPEISSGGKTLRSEHLFQMGLQIRIGDELWR